MMVLKSTAAATLAGLLLAGCASQYTPVPLASTFPTTTQPKVQAAYHWGVIADNIEKRLVAELKKNPPRPLYLNEPQQPTPFQRALAAQLITSLVNDGYTVSHTAPGALKIDLDVQAVTFAPNRPQYRYHGDPTALAAGVWVLSEIEMAPLAYASAGAGAFDYYNWFNAKYAPGPTPKTEIIVTVSVSDQYRFFARNTAAYYVADTDRALYGIVDKEPEAPKLTRMFQVRGDQ